MSVAGFASMPFVITQRQPIQIEMFYEMFSSKVQRFLYLIACLTSGGISGVLGWRAFMTSTTWHRETSSLQLIEWPFVLWTAIALGLVAIAFLFQVIHVLRAMWRQRECGLILTAFILVALLCTVPFLYKSSGLQLNSLAVGGIGFLVLMTLILLRVPLGFAMCLVGLLGLLAITRRPTAALNPIGSIPFTETTTFMMIAFPVFMLMGEIVGLAGLSGDLFDAAKKWMGRLPGGLAVASIGGCAGFGAVCGDSMATVITMSSVAMPSMRANGYSPALSAGTLAAGGTLGILIPPSMGFIIYSMITEVSVAKLFLAGIVPGILLSAIFIVIIITMAIRNPEIAPRADKYPLRDKLISLVKLIPVVILFLVVVMGILNGWFTPAEGGGIGAMMGFFYALIRRKLTWKLFVETMLRSTEMFGKIFAMFIGLKVLGAFLAASRVPLMLASFVVSLNVSPNLVLAAIIILYVILGCVMNIMPMMMLTLPSIYPTVQTLGFDGVWFGVLCVVVMEMGQITPPVGMNVFTMASLYPDIPTVTIFKGVAPFFLGMLLCIILIACFPQIALVFQ